MDSIVNRIKMIRKEKGYSHEFMAFQLDISQPAYSKIEKNETQLRVDRLFKIAEILQIPVNDILDISQPKFYNPTDSNHVVENRKDQGLYQENKNVAEKIELLYEARLKDKEEIITHLKNIIKSLEKHILKITLFFNMLYTSFS